MQLLCCECSRRSPSHVAAELVRLNQTNENDKAPSLMESVLQGFKRSDTHKETTLLVLGYISKYARKSIQSLMTVHPAKGCCGPSLRAGHLCDIFPDWKAKSCHPWNRILTGE